MQDDAGLLSSTSVLRASSKIEGVPSAALAMKMWKGTPLGVVNSFGQDREESVNILERAALDRNR